MSYKKGRCKDCFGITTSFKAERCRKCYGKTKKIHPDARSRRLKSVFGLEPGEFDAYWIVFLGKCPICKVNWDLPENNVRGTKNNTAVVDHDYKTNKIRGLLCGQCNKALGLFRDNINLLRSAIKYLEPFECEN